ncbi:MAG: hypothetical protein HC897_02080 [Thermoanaerobaculia bacterium]|nr:hypothetical protein [Thermoanaerobaculia bacterium]
MLGETAKCLAVWPRRLRSALLGEYFFSGSATAFNYRELLARVPDLTSAVAALIEARHTSVDVPIEDLRDLVEQYGSPIVWHSFAALGKVEAIWVLEHYQRFQPSPEFNPRRASEFYPRTLTDIVVEALEQAPEAAIPRLLELAAEERPKDLRQSERTLGCITHWLKVFPPHVDSPEPLHRRQLLLRLASDFLGSGGDRAVGAEALTMVLTPTCEMHGRDPGSGHTTTLKWGLLPEETLVGIESLWPEVHKALGVIDIAAWRPLRRILWLWLFPEGAAPSTEIRHEHAAHMRAFAARILTDLTAHAHGQLGLSSALKRLGKRIDLDLQIEIDPLFELLFPERRGSIDEVQAQSAATDLGIEELAENWADTGDPRGVAHQLAILERESSYIEHDHLADDNMRDLCIHLAGASVAPEKWLEAFLTVDMPGDITDLFLLRIVKLRRPGWETYVSNAFEIPSLCKQASALMLQDAEAPPHLLERALLEAPRIPEVVERAWGPDLPPLSTVRTLLKSSDRQVALFAACAEWTWKPKGMVREEVWDDWRSTILRSAEILDEGELDDTIVYDLALIFGKEPALALDWLRIRLRQPDTPPMVPARGLAADALRCLTKPQLDQLRKELGEESPPPGQPRSPGGAAA